MLIVFKLLGFGYCVDLSIGDGYSHFFHVHWRSQVNMSAFFIRYILYHSFD